MVIIKDQQNLAVHYSFLGWFLRCFRQYLGRLHGQRTSRESFFSKILNFWAWADKLGGNLGGQFGCFQPTYWHYFGTVSPLFMGKCSWIFFLQKTLVFRSKTQNSQMLPKYDIVRKEQRSHFRLWWLKPISNNQNISSNQIWLEYIHYITQYYAHKGIFQKPGKTSKF